MPPKISYANRMFCPKCNAWEFQLELHLYIDNEYNLCAECTRCHNKFKIKLVEIK